MPIARLNTERARVKLQDFKFSDLFIEELGWNQPASRKSTTIEHHGARWRALEVSQLSGFRVFEITPEDKTTPLPDTKVQQALWKLVALQSVENILIFIDAARTQSLWLWMKREEKRFLQRRHHFLKGQPGDLFLSKLAALFVDLSELDEEGNIDITAAKDRVQRALDVETVTKVFFRDFQDEHGRLLDQIKGIPDARERRWYASVLLNRLMFVWFLQEKFFLDADRTGRGNKFYLTEKLKESRKAGREQFFSHFLRDLFFEGFAKPSTRRTLVGTVALGDIPYLNGGLFLPHGIEARIEGDCVLNQPYSAIRIPDASFERLFTLFGNYSWSLNDTPGGDDREINPDVLGYIFEKYINQKEFGAYYTRPEITEYLCEQTIHQLVLDRANANFNAARTLHTANPTVFPSPHRFTALDDLLFHADGPLCARLLHDVLPSLSLLDPACGSGAFLVAAQKTLLNLYTALIGRCEALGHQPILKWMEGERAKHRHGSTETPAAYWLKKKIVTENLYGADIMEEATEIAKLRLFLSLVASAEKRDQLEPLPNIEFNLLAGNSLIGLLHVDAAAFDTRSGARKNGKADQERIEFEQRTGRGELEMTFASKTAPTREEKVGAHLAGVRAAKYKELLEEKNRLIASYKQLPDLLGAGVKDSDVLVGLRRTIEEKKTAAREVLDRLLLAEFQQLDIQFQQATWDEHEKTEGKSEKRPLRLGDIRALQPFHWAYEFDDILINRGGFDAIITNPPWEIFKPNSKEFFLQHSDLVSRNSMHVDDFEKEKGKILEDREIRTAWLDYLCSYPHVSEWFRSPTDYPNQAVVIKGKKVGSDHNYYKLFVERCYNLLARGGRCGIVIPSGIYTDLGSRQLRQMLFTQTQITGLFGFENRKHIFEGVDTRFKFVVLTLSKGEHTVSFPAAFMRHNVTELAAFPEEGHLPISVDLIKRLAPTSLSIPEFQSKQDVDIAVKASRFPQLKDSKDGWEFEIYGEEIHMNRGSGYFKDYETVNPLYEGGMVWQFDHRYAKPRHWIEEGELREDFLEKRRKRCGLDHIPKTLKADYECRRIAIRKIASNTNERTLIVALIPAGSFAGNSLAVHFPFQHDRKNFNEVRYSSSELCVLTALLNSFVADHLLRSRMTTNLNSFFLYQLPIPRVTRADEPFRPLVERAARLMGTTSEFDDLLSEVFGSKATHHTHGAKLPADRQRLRAELDAIVASLYELTDEEFSHILATFPLVDEGVKLTTRNTFRDLQRGILKV